MEGSGHSLFVHIYNRTLLDRLRKNHKQLQSITFVFQARSEPGTSQKNQTLPLETTCKFVNDYFFFLSSSVQVNPPSEPLDIDTIDLQRFEHLHMPRPLSITTNLHE